MGTCLTCRVRTIMHYYVQVLRDILGILPDFNDGVLSTDVLALCPVLIRAP